MAVQMKKMVEKELVDKYSAEISNLRISATPNSDGTINELDNVVVSLTPSEKVIKTIQPVNINFQETDAKMDTTDYETMKSMLANTWEIPISLIEIVSREEPGNEE